MKYILALFVLGLCSCQTTSQLSQLATPANVQVSITVLGEAASSKLTANDKTILHTFAKSLLALTAANVDSATISALVPSTSSASSAFVQPLIQTALVELNLALAKFGQHNVTVLAYANAVGNGLLGAGF
jgi:hypothetical protein